MGVPFIFVGVRQQNGCFDTHTFIQFSTYGVNDFKYCLPTSLQYTITFALGAACRLKLAPGAPSPPLHRTSLRTEKLSVQ